MALNEIGYGSADLAVLVDDNGTVKPFIVIELKSNPSTVFSKKAVEQARSYAKALNDPSMLLLVPGIWDCLRTPRRV